MKRTAFVMFVGLVCVVAMGCAKTGSGNDFQPLMVATTTFPDATQGEPYVATIVVLGGFPPYECSLEAGSLPDGLSLDTSTAEITGTPTTLGTSNFTILFTDSMGLERSVDLSITVYVITISTQCLPAGVVGEAYSATLEALGGTPGYTWSVESGTLPSSLGLDLATGEISGTPDASGIWNVTIRVTDAVSNTYDKDFSILINDPPLAAGEVTIYADQTDFTGYVYNGSAKYNSSLKTGNDTRRAWIKFDLSLVPAGATVTKVTAHWYVKVKQGSPNGFDITSLSGDPVVSGGATIWADIGGATVYVPDCYSTLTGWQSFVLSAQANTDITSDLSGKGWFGLGLKGFGPKPGG